MIETIRNDRGEIQDSNGMPLRAVAEVFRDNQRLRQNRVDEAEKPLGENTRILNGFSEFMRNQELIEQGIAPHDAQVALPEEVEARREEYEKAGAERNGLGEAYMIALDRYKAELHDAHQHFILNGGNQGPYVDAALEDANAEMERRGEPLLNRPSEISGDVRGELNPTAWAQLGAQFMSVADWLKEDSAADRSYLNGVGVFMDHASAIFTEEGATPEEARKMAASASLAVVATLLWQETGGVVNPSATPISQE